MSSHDVVIVGGGHNGLTSAALLARAGLDVVLLERLPHTGGAAVSAQAFPGLPPRLSRYSYLVSLMPEALMADLDLNLRLASRSVASYTPWTRAGRHGGLLVERPEGPATAASFRALTGSDAEYGAWQRFYADVATVADAVAPTLLDPLPRVRSLSDQVDPGVWASLIERPLGEVIRQSFTDDTVRGVVATDALIGTFADLDSPPWCRTAASSTTSSATAPASGGCPSAEWVPSPTPLPGQPVPQVPTSGRVPTYAASSSRTMAQRWSGPKAAPDTALGPGWCSAASRRGCCSGCWAVMPTRQSLSVPSSRSTSCSTVFHA
nr:FAD-dependent oxidoreductase [Nocardioides alcanivorans]